MKLSGKIYLVLCDIRSAFNVGSLFRTADAAGVSEIILVGYTPEPVDRFGRKRKDMAKVSLGAEATVPWKHFPTLEGALGFLKKENVFLIALEQAEESKDYKKIKPAYPAALFVGNEVSGLPKKLLRKCHVVAQIPMRGGKESLNVAVAAGIALFRIFNL